MQPLWQSNLALTCRPFGVQQTAIWSPFGAQRAPSWPRRRPRGPSGAQEAPRRPQDEPQRRPRDPKLSPRGAQEAPSRAQEASQKAPRAAKKQSKSTWRLKIAISEKVAKVPYCRANLEVRGALERHLDAKLEPRMASKCALAVQLGSPRGL